MMWYWGGGGIHWWGWLFMILVTVVFWGLAIWCVIYLARTLVHGPRPPAQLHAPDDSPERILARRLAVGEIDEEEFNRRFDALRQSQRT